MHNTVLSARSATGTNSSGSTAVRLLALIAVTLATRMPVAHLSEGGGQYAIRVVLTLPESDDLGFPAYRCVASCAIAPRAFPQCQGIPCRGVHDARRGHLACGTDAGRVNHCRLSRDGAGADTGGTEGDADSGTVWLACVHRNGHDKISIWDLLAELRLALVDRPARGPARAASTKSPPHSALEVLRDAVQVLLIEIRFSGDACKVWKDVFTCGGSQTVTGENEYKEQPDDQRDRLTYDPTGCSCDEGLLHPTCLEAAAATAAVFEGRPLHLDDETTAHTEVLAALNHYTTKLTYEDITVMLDLISSLQFSRMCPGIIRRT
ncbi:hypothetical protein F5148DRAFT_1150567 [Russula earlei]|uniref:Uncharacterized protein n=1 Tax=Russula earlei TaxID=71964 RepID=A0ACC0U571_9AGAM|nr:hypothetical protein F5148DRAFT_1150567 [Russula earlei]